MEITEIYTGPLFVKTWAVPLDGKTTLLVDPGGFDEELQEYLEQKKTSALKILLTHGHFDHLGGVPALMQRYPNSSLYIHKADSHYLGKNAFKAHIDCFKPIKADRYIHDFKYEFPEPTNFLENNKTIFGLKIIHTPGHTEGSVCLWNEKENFIFAGDTLFFRSHGRTDLVGGDELKLKKSLKLLLNLPDTTVVYPGHGSNTTIGNERSWINAL